MLVGGANRMGMPGGLGPVQAEKAWAEGGRGELPKRCARERGREGGGKKRKGQVPSHFPSMLHDSLIAERCHDTVKSAVMRLHCLTWGPS